MSTNATPALPPPPPSPEDAASAVQSVPHTRGEKIMSAIGSRATAFASGAGSINGTPRREFSNTAVGKAMDQHYQTRLAEARRNWQDAQTKLQVLNGNVDPQTGQPLSPQQRQDLYNEAQGAWGAYAKTAGVDKETKAQIAQKKNIFDLALTHGIKAAHEIATNLGIAQPSGDKSSSGGSASPVPPPPSPSAGPQQASADTPAGATTNAAVPPPPAAPAAPAAGAGAGYDPGMNVDAGRVRQQLADRRQIALDQAKADIQTKAKIEQDKAKGQGKAKHLQHVPVTNPKTGQTEPGSYDPDSGEYLDQQGNIIENAQLAAKQVSYKGPNDTPLIGWQIGDTLYDQEMKPLPAGTEKFVAWMQPRTTTSETMKEVVQPDGSIKLVPVETSSTTTRGGGGGAGGAGGAGGGAGKPPAATVKGGGQTAGGKVPPGVTKAYEAYNGAQERFAVMQDALPRALAGDQQAMLNLLANHVGMTMGLQKGARITQGVYSEAEQSAPWLARVDARFDKNGYLTGVVLTPEQMKQMIDLAKVRLEQDKAAWQREIGAAKEGYGMTPPPTPKGSVKGKKSGGAPPKTAQDYLDSIGVAH